MKKRRILLLLLSLLILIHQLFTAYGQGGVGIGIQVIDTSGPIINLIEPINNSGNMNGNITFFYNASDASDISNCSLIIKNNVNLTNYSLIIKDTRLNFTLNNSPIGIYNWSINCTDELGNVGESPKRTITVNSMTKFNGSTTNLSLVDTRNIINFVLESTDSGKINFSENVDLSQGFDLDRYINISFNKIELNSTALPVLNKSATLQLYGLTFSDPRILRDGSVCPSDICAKISYPGGTLIFTVTHFTVYSAEETPVEAAPPAAPSGGGGGGGGGGANFTVSTDFSVDKIALKVVLKQGETKKETLNIKNTGTSMFDIKAYLQGIEKFKVSPEEHEVTTTLQPNEEKTIELVFKALKNEKPDIYPARIIFKGPSTEKEVATVVEVDSAEPLFDVDVEVLPEAKKIFPGEEILLEVNLFNIRGFGRVDVSVEYAIKDLDGNLIATEHETLAVETQAKFTRSLLVPSDLKPGTYVALTKVIYGDSIGTSSDLFEVKAKSIKLYPIQIKDYKFILLGGAVVAVVAIILIFSAYQIGYFKKKAPKTKVEEVKLLKEEEKAQKLKKELKALEEARKAGFISEGSYQKDKERIEDKLKSLK